MQSMCFKSLFCVVNLLQRKGKTAKTYNSWIPQFIYILMIPKYICLEVGM